MRKFPTGSQVPVLEEADRDLILSNRQKELKLGVEQLSKHRLLVITGMPGIGKSTYARVLLDFMPKNSYRPFWYNFDRHKNSGNSLGTLLEQISGYLDSQLKENVRQDVLSFRDSGGQASATDVDILMEFLKQDREFWLVFDNLETVLSRETNKFLDERLEILFETLKNGQHNAKIIITNPFVPVLQDGGLYLEGGIPELTLTGLDDEFEIEYLQAYGLKGLSEKELLPLVREINGHPFILNYVARYVRALGVKAAVENLNMGLEDISEQFGKSLKKRLSEQEFTALQSLSILNREISFQDLRQISQVKLQVVIHLREMGLLQRSEDGAFWLHNIVRNSIRSIDPEKLEQAHLLAMDFYRNQTQPSHHQTIDDYANVFEWHFHAVEAGNIKNAYEALYSTGLEEKLLKWSEYELVANLCERTLSANKSRQNVLLSEQLIKLHRTLGAVHYYLGDFPKSITFLETAVDSSQAGIDDDLEINLLIELAESFNGNREFAQALNLCQKAITLITDREEGNKLRAKAFHLRGIVNRDQGNLDQAIHDLESALDLYVSINDRVHIGNLSVDLGFVYYQMNRFSKAITYHQNALNSHEKQHDARGAMIAHFNIGDIYLQDSKLELALSEFRTSFDIARKKKISWMEAFAGLYLAETQIALMDFDGAEQSLDVIRPVIIKQSSNCLSAHELALTAILSWNQKQIENADDCFNRAFDLFEKADCQEQKARSYIAYALFLNEQERFTQSKKAMNKCRTIFNDLNNQLGLKAIEKAVSEIKKD